LLKFHSTPTQAGVLFLLVGMGLRAVVAVVALRQSRLRGTSCLKTVSSPLKIS